MNTAEQETPITPAPDCQNWLALHDMGFSLIPLKASGKVPYIAWQAHQKTHLVAALPARGDRRR